jgi:hypothetical protein
MSAQKAGVGSVAPALPCAASDGWRIVRGLALFPIQVVMLAAYILYLAVFLVIAIVIATVDAAMRK